MKVENIKVTNHRYSIDIPDKIYTALKVKAAIERKSVKAIILNSLKDVIDDGEQKEILSFVNSSNKIFAEEWNSKEDDEAFEHLQKYKK